MPRIIKPTKKKITGWIIHFIIFLIGMFAFWFWCYYGKEGWVYPWPSWISGAWGLSVIVHACLVWSNYEDKGLAEFRRQTME